MTDTVGDAAIDPNGEDECNDPQGGPRRILVTGSRTWTDVAPIRAALATVWGDGTAVLVSGACPAAPTTSPTRFGPAGAAGSNAILPTGPGTAARPATDATRPWSLPAAPSASRSSMSARLGPATPLASQRMQEYPTRRHVQAQEEARR